MKILLTGANGQVGKEIQEVVKNHPVELIAFGSKELDITKASVVNHLLKAHRPTVVINAAAYTKVDLAEQESETAYLVNREGAKNLALACADINALLVHLSTDYVFDGLENQPCSEELKPNPLNIYGKSKWEGERLVQSLAKQYLILRTSWVFGQYGSNFVKTILALARKQSEISVINDCYGCPTSARSIAEVLLQIVTRKSPLQSGIYHFCNAPYTTWYQFAEKIVEIGTRIGLISPVTVKPISHRDYETVAKRPIYSVLNCKKIIEAFDVAICRWEQELEQMLSKASL